MALTDTIRTALAAAMRRHPEMVRTVMVTVDDNTTEGGDGLAGAWSFAREATEAGMVSGQQTTVTISSAYFTADPTALVGCLATVTPAGGAPRTMRVQAAVPRYVGAYYVLTLVQPERTA